MPLAPYLILSNRPSHKLIVGKKDLVRLYSAIQAFNGNSIYKGTKQLLRTTKWAPLVYVIQLQLRITNTAFTLGRNMFGLIMNENVSQWKLFTSGDAFRESWPKDVYSEHVLNFLTTTNMSNMTAESGEESSDRMAWQVRLKHRMNAPARSRCIFGTIVVIKILCVFRHRINYTTRHETCLKRSDIKREQSMQETCFVKTSLL